MYNPLSDLHKMFLTPEFILFRVEIKGQEYLGRPNTLVVDHQWVPGKNQEAKFRTSSSIQSFLARYVDDEIPVTSGIIKGLEAIDTVDPGPLNAILAACNDINNVAEVPNIGTLYRDIPPMLVALIHAVEDYEQLHGQPRFEVMYDDIEDLRKECVRCPADLSDNGRAGIVGNLKEKIGSRVTRLIEIGSSIPLT